MRRTYLRTAREARGIGIRQLAKDANVDLGYLSKIERGLSVPSIKTLIRIMRALGMDEDEEMVRLLITQEGSE